jgi:hypothetical protein
MFCAFGLVFSGYVRVFSRFHVLHAPNSFSAVSTASGPVFMFCVPEYIFGGTDGFGSRFHVLSSRTHFRRYCGRPLRFSCFALPDMFLAVKRASDPVFIFCAPELIFGGPKGVGSRYHFLRCQTRFQRYCECPVHFSCFARPDSFLAVRRASSPVFMFCAPRHVFDGAEGVRSRFPVLHSWTFFRGTEGVSSHFNVVRCRTHFRRYRGRRLLFLCFARSDSFSTVTKASGPVFILCAPEHVFGCVEGVESYFHVLRSRTRFRRCRGHRVPFSYFALADSFSSVPRASAPVIMICAVGLISAVTRASVPVLMF